MELITNLDEIPSIKKPIVTSGTFDGVHFGHQKILVRLRRQAKKLHGCSVLLTYWPHPRYVLGNGWGDLKLLNTFDEKVSLIAKNGIDYMIKIPFTREFSEMRAYHFLEEILVNRIATHQLLLGYDHRFGKNAEGGFEFLKAHQDKFQIQLEEIPRQDIENSGVSSTKIREYLHNGHVSNAAKLLGRYYQIEGIIEKGDQIGRQLGFPTANLHIDQEYKLIPKDGVYAVQAIVDGINYKGMLNIGFRPTIGGLKKKIEAHIFDFDQDIYGRNMKVNFVGRIREEKKFNDRKKLIDQLLIDKENSLSVLTYVP